MKLEIKCYQCNKLLGFYQGEEFFIVGQGRKDLAVQCSDCRGDKK